MCLVFLLESIRNIPNSHFSSSCFICWSIQVAAQKISLQDYRPEVKVSLSLLYWSFCFYFYHRLCYILNSCPYFLCLSQVPEIQEEESLVNIFFSVVFLAHHSMSDKQLMLSNGWLNEYQLRSKSHVFQSLPCISYSSEVSISDVIHYIPEN